MSKDVILLCDAASCNNEARGHYPEGWYIIRFEEPPNEEHKTYSKTVYWYFCSDACLALSLGQGTSLMKVEEEAFAYRGSGLPPATERATITKGK